MLDPVSECGGAQVAPKRALLAGFVVGGMLGLANLVIPLSYFLDLAVLAWVLGRGPGLPAIAGGLIGFGASWLLLIGRMSVACAADTSCTQPDTLWFWLAIGAGSLVAGAVLALVARSQPAR
jgi:hypothetical protein